MPKFSSLSLLLGCLTWSSFVIFSVAAQDVPPIQQRGTQRSEAAVADWFDKHRAQPPALRAFVQRMPKGGDIHSHLSGAVYAERYLQWAAADGYCVDPTAKTLIEPSACGQNPLYFPASDLWTSRTSIYDALVNKWSTRNLSFAGQSGHDQFFSAFAGFDLISSAKSRQDDMVAEVANQAASQKVSYLELMLTTQGSSVRQLGRSVGWTGNLAQMQQKLRDRGLRKLVAQGSQELAELGRQVPITLGCGTAAAQPGCRVTVRYLQQTTRTKSPAEVFAQFLYAFELAKIDPRVVGINLVAPEDHPVALRDYTLQMEMLKFLRREFPDIKVALHAGELTLGLVPPQDLRFHIRQAVEMAQAQRIGHGVGLMYEDNPFELMAEMRRRGVLVEICLTSNEVILNVKGDEHPFRHYWAAGVPLTLTSDDEGIARIDLSHEYGLAARRYNLGYRDLKRLARNSLEYSFLKGQSLWRSPEFTGVAVACANDTPGAKRLSASCTTWLQKSDRARLQWQLETDFAEFETLAWLR